jgi:gliding motility-associated-like protein
LFFYGFQAQKIELHKDLHINFREGINPIFIRQSGLVKTFINAKTKRTAFDRCLLLPLVLMCTFFFNASRAQNCPTNIDFESGTFAGWSCYTGSVASVAGQNVISLFNAYGPVPERQTMYGPNAGLDPYGNFPINCPNGSGHSIRLGNNTGGGQAEGISYDFIIPADRDIYSLIYHYAVVFQDPNHEESQQPRMEIEITNVTDNTVISCSSFTFYPYGSLLPGFFISTRNEGTPVLCKSWSAVSINLNGMAGKTIRLFFKTADCTFRNHFGYAYIDVNSECSSEFRGAAFCPDDSVVTLTAPYGYQNYTWYDKNFNQVVGNAQSLVLKPLPPAGTEMAVKVEPYNGYGCTDTFYAKMLDSLKVKAYAGPDIVFCNEPVRLGTFPKSDFTYTWSPPDGLNDPSLSNPQASPTVSTTYVLSVVHSGGGCKSTDTVLVKSSFSDNTIALLGKEAYCIGSGDSAILTVKPTSNIQWFRDDVPIPGANKAEFRVRETGLYHAQLTNDAGCIVFTSKKQIIIDRARPGISYPVQYAVENRPFPLQARQFGSSLTWSPAANLDNPASVTPMFTGNTDQAYIITIVTNSGCVTKDTQVVKTVKRAEIYVPSGFTPNGDGLNDYLKPVLMGIKELQYFRIYNRWGRMIYESRKILPGWDGSVNGVKQESQVVVWTVEGIGYDGNIYTRKGTTMLVR